MTGDLVPVGRVEDVPDGGCVAAADGRVLLTRGGGEVRAFRNRCLHTDEPLDGGLVRDGVLTCPAHFWRYRLRDGRQVGHARGLEPLACEVRGGTVHVAVPIGEASSMRELLLAHARDWSREA